MKDANTYEVIIIGGSYAGLSAALALGRSLRKVLIIDAGQPCNRFTPHSHNFIAHDGHKPAEIAQQAKEQVRNYKTVEFHDGFVKQVSKQPDGFEVSTEGHKFVAKKLILASGIKDKLPDIDGFAACWGISAIHCPYCHGYEFKGMKTGILANGDDAFHYAKLISNLTEDLKIFTNGEASFSDEQLKKLADHSIKIVETPIERLEHKDGYINRLLLTDGERFSINALYHGPEFEHYKNIPQQLGCTIAEHGLVEVDGFQKTSVPGVYACGDISNMRSLAIAAASGTKAGSVINMELIDEMF